MDLAAGPIKKNTKMPTFVFPSENQATGFAPRNPRIVTLHKRRKVTGIDCYRPIETTGEGFSKCAAAGRAA